MKLVKKLLRLLPLFIILSVLLSIIFSKAYTLDSSSNFTTYISNNLQNLSNNPLFDWVTGNNIWGQFYNWIRNNLFNGRSPSTLLFTYSILVYELNLSIMFLMFDVFNFVIGVANKWLKKGGNLDD